jgi:hypothetical protein
MGPCVILLRGYAGWVCVRVHVHTRKKASFVWILVVSRPRRASTSRQQTMGIAMAATLRLLPEISAGVYVRTGICRRACCLFCLPHACLRHDTVVLLCMTFMSSFHSCMPIRKTSHHRGLHVHTLSTHNSRRQQQTSRSVSRTTRRRCTNAPTTR